MDRTGAAEQLTIDASFERVQPQSPHVVDANTAPANDVAAAAAAAAVARLREQHQVQPLRRCSLERAEEMEGELEKEVKCVRRDGWHEQRWLLNMQA